MTGSRRFSTEKMMSCAHLRSMGYRLLKYVHSVTTFSEGGKGREGRARSTYASILPRSCPTDPPSRIARSCTQFVNWLQPPRKSSKSELIAAARAAAPFEVVMLQHGQPHSRFPSRSPTQTHANLAAAALVQRPQGPALQEFIFLPSRNAAQIGGGPNWG